MTQGIEKAELVTRLKKVLEADLHAITEGQREAQAGATHQEAKSEGDKDMRATEVSYLARGLAKRVTELRSAIAQLATFVPRAFDQDSLLAMGALAIVENEDGALTHYFLAPCGGGVTLLQADLKFLVVTPSSPLGQALKGRRCGDALELRTPQGVKQLTIVEIA